MPTALKTTAAGLSTALVLVVGVFIALGVAGGVVGFDGWRSRIDWQDHSREVSTPARHTAVPRATPRLALRRAAPLAHAKAPAASAGALHRSEGARSAPRAAPSLPARRPPARPHRVPPPRTPTASPVAQAPQPATPTPAPHRAGLGDTTRKVTSDLGHTVAPVSPVLGRTVTDAGAALSDVLPK